MCSDAAGDSLLLQAPSGDLQDSYRSLIAEFDAHRERRAPFVLDYPSDDFTALLARLRNEAQGIGLPGGFVPHSTFWLVRNGSDIVGVSNLRHRLNEKLARVGGHIGYGIRPGARRNGYATALLRKTLARAGEIGIRRVLVTCGKQNIGSAKAILANGGVFESEEFSAEHDEVVQRYWIPNAP